MIRLFTALAALTLPAIGLSAKDSLGVYSNWAAFRDAETPRCYAIAEPRGDNATDAYASIGTWPNRNVRNQVYFRLSQTLAQGRTARLRIGRASFVLSTNGRDAWAQNRRADAAIVAAIRSAETMRVSGRGSDGVFSDRYDLAGVATAMDAAVVGCANRR